jgi:hypothetical protein
MRSVKVWYPGWLCARCSNSRANVNQRESINKESNMANLTEHWLVVIGLKENPYKFAESLELEMYGTIVPHEGDNLFVEVANGGFEYSTKSGPSIDALIELSKKREDHVFLLQYGSSENHSNGQAVIRNGDRVESIHRIGYFGLFDEIERPLVDLFEPYLQERTLAQCAENRLRSAVRTVRGLIRMMEDRRFTNSPHTFYSECRNRAQTDTVRAGLAALADSMDQQLRQIDFRGVLLDESDLREGAVRIAEKSRDLMKTLGLDYVAAAPGRAIRFAILPLKTASIDNPARVIVPVLQYLNADLVSGKYAKNADGLMPAIEWRIGYVCLTRFEVSQFKRLPDDDQTVCDIDFITTYDEDRGYQLQRASHQARWRLDADLAEKVNEAAAKMSDVLSAKIADRPGIAIFDDFQAVEAVLF